MNTLLALILSLTLTAPALAVPYSYEFTSGGLTGSFVAEPEIILTPGQYAFQSWSITPPLGPTWSSTDRDADYFDNFNSGPTMNLVLTTQQHPNGNPLLGITIIDLGELNPQGTSGPYSWILQLADTTSNGVGTWARTTQSVPLPDMLWLTLFMGLAGLGWLWWREWRQSQ